MTTCAHCNKSLRSIGKQRKNGRYFIGNDGNDWSKRLYHKKCWKIVGPLITREKMERLEQYEKQNCEK